MYYAIYGTDYKKKAEKKDELLALLRTKRPGAEFFTLDKDGFSDESLDSLLSSQGLFEKKIIAVLSGLLEQKISKKKDEDGESDGEEEDRGVKKKILEKLPMLSSSNNAFVLFDGPLDAKTADAVKKYAYKTFSMGEKIAERKDNTVFDMCDAFCSGDQKKAWVLYQKAIRNGESPEAILGALFSSIKTILLTKKVRTAGEAGVHPYPFGKAIEFGRRYSEKEAERLLSELVDIYHKIRSEGGELSVELEKFILR